MLREHYIFFKRLHLAFDCLVVAACYALSVWLTMGTPPGTVIHEPALLVAITVTALVLGSGIRPYEYRFRKLTAIIAIISRRWMAALTVLLLLLLGNAAWQPARTTLAVFAGSGWLGLLGVHLGVAVLLRAWRRSGRSYKKALIIGTGVPAQQMAHTILAQPERGLRIIGFLDRPSSTKLWRFRDIPLRGSYADLPRLIKSEQIDFVLFCLDGHELAKVHGLVRYCTRTGVPTVVDTDWFGDLTARSRADEFFGKPGMILDVAPRPSTAVIAKTLFDRVLALVGIVIAAPLMIATALAIKSTSPGPVIFSQERMGHNGRRFRMWKFRTMVSGAESMRAALESRNEISGPAFKLSDDPRVTPLGRFLRRSSIDELPQLFNVLRGDMSLVGPRPPLPDEVSRYTGWQRRRLSVKPGLTCLWQISGRSKITDFDEWMRLDLKYIDDWSIRKDAEILAKTIPAVLKGSGAQ